MKPAQTGGPDYASRIRRAQYLATAHPFAAEVLTFYKEITQFQKTSYAEIRRRGVGVSSRETVEAWPATNFAPFLSTFSDMLAMLQANGPAPVRDAARQLSARGRDEWSAQLLDFWNSRGTSEPDRSHDANDSGRRLSNFILRAFVQPYAEFVAGREPEPPLTTNYRVCPRCGAAPLVGVLRPEGEGGKRRLLCSFCLQEWDSRRIFCAACGESDEKKLPVYVAEQFPHIRVDACETCHFYVRTIDLTKDGNAVPIVDDLTAIPLSLWAGEHGYKRVQENLLGT